MEQSESFACILRSSMLQSKKGITFIYSHNCKEKILYKDLYSISMRILKYLYHVGLKKGDKLILQTNSNKDFFGIFLACLFGGICIIPIESGYSCDHKMKLIKVWKTLECSKIICHKEYTKKVGEFAGEEKEIMFQIKENFINIDDIYSIAQEASEVIEFSSEDIVHIQLSSGSTGEPKGVVINQKNLIINLMAIKNALELTNQDISLCWVPPTHDMGLISHLIPMLIDMEQHSMPTNMFVKNPCYYLEHIQKHQVTITQLPNFGLNYILMHYFKRRIKNVDLSSLRVILNGAEPINYELCREFIKRMGQFNLKQNVICPAYGLAEATLAVSIVKPGEEVSTAIVDRNHLSIGNTIRYLASQKQKDAVVLVKEGEIVTGCAVEIRNERGVSIGENKLGIIYIKGDNVTSGYYNNPLATQQMIMGDNWLNTGDLGFLNNGEIVVVGRQKEVIRIKGRNYYSHDLEQVVEKIEGLYQGKFVITSGYTGIVHKESLVVFLVTNKSYEDMLPLIQKIETKLLEQCGLVLDDVILISQIPKTTSGKFQRFKLSENYSKGEYIRKVIS